MSQSKQSIWVFADYRNYFQNRVTLQLLAKANDLATDLDDRAMALSQVAADRQLVAISDPRVSAIAVLGAVEALALASVRNQVQMDPIETTKSLISIVLEGLQK